MVRTIQNVVGPNANAPMKPLQKCTAPYQQCCGEAAWGLQALFGGTITCRKDWDRQTRRRCNAQQVAEEREGSAQGRAGTHGQQHCAGSHQTTRMAGTLAESAGRGGPVRGSHADECHDDDIDGAVEDAHGQRIADSVAHHLRLNHIEHLRVQYGKLQGSARQRVSLPQEHQASLVPLLPSQTCCRVLKAEGQRCPHGA